MTFCLPTFSLQKKLVCKTLKDFPEERKWKKSHSWARYTAQWYMRVRRAKIKVFKKLLFDDISTWIGYFGPVNTIYCWVRRVWSEFMSFKETWNYRIFPILCFLGVKLTIVAKPQIPNNIPFWDTMYEP